MMWFVDEGGFVRACVPVCVCVACLLALVRASYEALRRAYRLCLYAFFERCLNIIIQNYEFSTHKGVNYR